MGSSLTSETYGLKEFANATWVMGLNGSAWLLVTALLTHKMDKITKIVAGSTPKKMAAFSTGAMCGAIGYLHSKELIKIVTPRRQKPCSCCYLWLRRNADSAEADRK